MQMCNHYSMVLVPLYDTLGKESVQVSRTCSVWHRYCYSFIIPLLSVVICLICGSGEMLLNMFNE